MSITLMCDSLRAAGAIQGGAGIGIAMASSRVLVTCIGTASGRLKLITWRVGADGRTLARLADSGTQAGNVSLVDICMAAADRFICAVRAGNGHLLLMAWHVNAVTGAVTRRADSGDVEGGLSLVAMTPSPRGDGSVIIAVRDVAGHLVLKHWALLTGDVLKRLGDTALQGQSAGAIGALAIGHAGANRVVTAVRTNGGNLKLIIWDVLAAGGIKRLGDSGAQGGPADQIDLCTIGGFVVSATCASAGGFKLTSWRVAADGSAVTLAADSGNLAGATDRVACLAMPREGGFQATAVDRVVTAVRASHGGLKLIVWTLAANGTPTRGNDFDEHTGAIQSVRMWPVGSEAFVTAVQRGSGSMGLQSWRLDAPQPEVAPDGLLLYGKSMYESTPQVVAPGPACPKGRVVVNLGQPRGEAGFALRDLLGTNNAIAPSAMGSFVGYPLDAATQANATDNQIIRLPGGALLAIKNGYAWGDISPRPDWFDTVSISGQASKRARNAVYVCHSADGGLSWTLRSTIDSAVVVAGKYGWPQTEGAAGVGGFDRTELYRDPWSGALYVSGHGDGGIYTRGDGTTVDNHAGMIFRSADQAATWSVLHQFDQRSKGNAPYAMTSTAAHPLIVFQNLAGVPTLHVLPKGASTLTVGLDASEVEAGVRLKADADGAGDKSWSRPVSIARIDSDGSRSRVRIAYPTLNANSSHDYRVCIVTIDADAKVQVDGQLTITAADPANTSCALGCFVESDRIDSSASDAHGLYYWMEVPLPNNAAGRIAVRCKLFSGPTGHHRSVWLSLAAGLRHDIANQSIGHYVKGAHFVWNQRGHVLALWQEPDAVRGNVVALPL